MQSIATPHTQETSSHLPANLHAAKHVDSHSIGDSVKYGMLITIGCFIPLGVMIGMDRAPGSFYVYGFSCFIWPMISCIGLGAAIGGSLGYVFGAIGHASDPTPEPGTEPVAKVAKSHGIHLSLHSHRH